MSNQNRSTAARVRSRIAGMEGGGLAVLHGPSSLVDQDGKTELGDRPKGGAVGGNEQGSRVAACLRPSPRDQSVAMVGEHIDDRFAEEFTHSRGKTLHLGPGGSDHQH